MNNSDGFLGDRGRSAPHVGGVTPPRGRSGARARTLLVALAVLGAASAGARADTTTLSPMECGIAGQVAYAAALVRDAGGVEMQEHDKIDGFLDDYPRRELWRLTHSIVAWTYQNRALSPMQLGVDIVDQCNAKGGKLSFTEMESL